MFRATNLTKRLGAALALVAALAALAAPAALAGGSDTSGSAQAVYYGLDPWLKTAIAAHQGVGVFDRYTQLDPWLRTAIAAQGGQSAGYTPPQTSVPPAAPTVTTVQSTGFEWSSFGIGIGAGVGALLILAVAGSRVGRVRQLVSA